MKNISATDRMIKLLFAVVIAVIYLARPIEGALAIVWGLAAVILTVTAVINFCPVYHLPGFSTRNKSAQS